MTANAHINANPCVEHNTPFCLPCGYSKAAAELRQTKERLGKALDEANRYRELNIELVARTMRVSMSHATRTYRIEIAFDPRMFHEKDRVLELLHHGLDHSARRGWQ